MDRARFEELKAKRSEEGLTDDEANELGRMFAEEEGERYANADMRPSPEETPDAWKATVEQYLASLGRSYVVRFRDGTSNIGPPASDLDLAHTACWMDLHQRNSNLETFFQDFPRN